MKVDTSSFCGNHSSLVEPWLHHGISQCFLETVGTSVLLGIIMVFGGLQLLMYWKYSTKVEREFRPQSFLYVLQIFLTVILPVQYIVRVVFQGTILSNQLSLYQIFSAVGSSLAWLLSIGVICSERVYMLPSIPTRGHGLIILAFWTLAFIKEGLAFISWFSPDWWFTNRE